MRLLILLLLTTLFFNLSGQYEFLINNGLVNSFTEDQIVLLNREVLGIPSEAKKIKLHHYEGDLKWKYKDSIIDFKFDSETKIKGQIELNSYNLTENIQYEYILAKNTESSTYEIKYDENNEIKKYLKYIETDFGNKTKHRDTLINCHQLDSVFIDSITLNKYSKYDFQKELCSSNDSMSYDSLGRLTYIKDYVMLRKDSSKVSGTDVDGFPIGEFEKTLYEHKLQYQSGLLSSIQVIENGKVKWNYSLDYKHSKKTITIMHQGYLLVEITYK